LPSKELSCGGSKEKSLGAIAAGGGARNTVPIFVAALNHESLKCQPKDTQKNKNRLNGNHLRIREILAARQFSHSLTSFLIGGTGKSLSGNQ
jgi:hypothetical protein